MLIHTITELIHLRSSSWEVGGKLRGKLMWTKREQVKLRWYSQIVTRAQRPNWGALICDSEALAIVPPYQSMITQTTDSKKKKKRWATDFILFYTIFVHILSFSRFNLYLSPCFLEKFDNAISPNRYWTSDSNKLLPMVPHTFKYRTNKHTNYIKYMYEKLLKGQTYHREKKAIRQLLLAKGQTGVSRNCVRTGFTGLIRLKLYALKHTPADMEL